MCVFFLFLVCPDPWASLSNSLFYPEFMCDEEGFKQFMKKVVALCCLSGINQELLRVLGTKFTINWMWEFHWEQSPTPQSEVGEQLWSLLLKAPLGVSLSKLQVLHSLCAIWLFLWCTLPNEITLVLHIAIYRLCPFTNIYKYGPLFSVPRSTFLPTLSTIQWVKFIFI